jgi:lipoyl(octanoyl) transferase
MSTCRLLPYAAADGPHNMAADEVLLRSAAEGTASLRFYGWTEATLSLGYFQPERLRSADERLAGLPYVRRPSGGDTLVHHHEVTYALALPPGQPWHSGESWLCRMHQIIQMALNELEVPCRLHSAVGKPQFTGSLCFQHFSDADVILANAKIVGSAQRRQRGALLQHGAILLAGSPFTAALPGIRELAGKTLAIEEVCTAVERAFARSTGWELVAGVWTAAERLSIAELVVAKYTQDAWNRKR